MSSGFNANTPIGKLGTLAVLLFDIYLASPLQDGPLYRFHAAPVYTTRRVSTTSPTLATALETVATAKRSLRTTRQPTSKRLPTGKTIERYFSGATIINTPKTPPATSVGPRTFDAEHSVGNFATLVSPLSKPVLPRSSPIQSAGGALSSFTAVATSSTPFSEEVNQNRSNSMKSGILNPATSSIRTIAATFATSRIPIYAYSSSGKDNSNFLLKNSIAHGTWFPANQQTSEASNGTLQSVPNEGAVVLALCAYPPFSDREKCIGQRYYRDHLILCESRGGAIVFGCLASFLGASITFFNVMLLVIVWKNSDMRSHYNYIKASLAISDVIAGFLLLFSVLPNVTRLRYLTEEQAVTYIAEDTNSPRAAVVGGLLVVSCQASLLHLLFLSIERFAVIKWTFWHKLRKTRSVVVTLGAIWLTSLVSSFIPAAFPDHFEYKFQPALLTHMLTEKLHPPDVNGERHLGFHGPVYAGITLLLPYVIMIVFCILTGIASYRRINSGVRKLNGDSTRSDIYALSHRTRRNSAFRINDTQKPRLKTELSVFVTILTMVVAFSVTLLPFTIVMLLFDNGKLDCHNYSFPYVISFYVGLMNSLWNPLIYSVRDRRFRSTVRTLFHQRKNTSKERSSSRSISRTRSSTSRL